MLRTSNATAPVMFLEGAGAPVGSTLVDALTGVECVHLSVHRRSRIDLADLEVEDVRATALAWLSDIAKG